MKPLLGTLALLSFLLTFVMMAWRVDDNTKRINAIEKIVGFETPASMMWTNGHTYTTIVKHSSNCGCLKK